MTPNINWCADIDDNSNDDDDDVTMFTKSISTWFNFHLSFICCDKVSPLYPTDTHTHTHTHAVCASWTSKHVVYRSQFIAPLIRTKLHDFTFYWRCLYIATACVRSLKIIYSDEQRNNNKYKRHKKNQFHINTESQLNYNHKTVMCFIFCFCFLSLRSVSFFPFFSLRHFSMWKCQRIKSPVSIEYALHMLPWHGCFFFSHFVLLSAVKGEMETCKNNHRRFVKHLQLEQQQRHWKKLHWTLIFKWLKWVSITYTLSFSLFLLLSFFVSFTLFLSERVRIEFWSIILST